MLDLAGRRVQVLADREYAAGPQSLAWHRGGLGAGVYWVRVTAGDERAARRIVVIG